jgi:pimeloyl-ACP methyl ester carboxylesterase
MGGTATHIAAERYGNRFDGALAVCGGAASISTAADFFVAGAYAAGVTQREYDTTPVSRLVHDRILPALQRPQAHRRFEDIMVSLTGGPRAFDREGFQAEEELNWQRSEGLVLVGLAPNRDTVYRLGPPSPVTSREFNRAAIRLRTSEAAMRAFWAGNTTTGKLEIPLLTIHMTGDGQVPIEQARILQRRIDAARRHELVVQRVIRDPGHCGFTSTEWEASLEDLVRWVEQGVRPSGNNVLVPHLSDLRRRFELSPRPGTPEGETVPGAERRVTLHGKLTLDGAPFDARWLGAVVRRPDGLIAACQLTLPLVRGGRYEIVVMADAEASGCGAPGAEIALWTFARNRILYSRDVSKWPRTQRVRADLSFSSATPSGAVPPRAQFNGEVFTPDGRQLQGGTRVDAYVGTSLCGVTSVRRTGSYSGFTLDVAGPDSVPGCARGATITFRVDGRPAQETAVNEPERPGLLDLTVP